MTHKNSNLHSAKVVKNDEFYTIYKDIEDELNHYMHHFENKVIYCNCDNYYKSNFFKYFVFNFNKFKLSKLICTCFSPKKKHTLFDMAEEKPVNDKPYKIEITAVIDDKLSTMTNESTVSDIINCTTNTQSILNKDGDFRSPECVELLKESDIIVSNPPFSLFREYISILMEHGKKFIVIGNQNAVTYKEVFPLLKDDEMWIGYNTVKEFVQPDGTVKKFGNICWFTNLDIDKRHEELVFTKHFNQDEYPIYDNYAAFNVDKLSDIPIETDFEMIVTEERLKELQAMGFDIEIIEEIAE